MGVAGRRGPEKGSPAGKKTAPSLGQPMAGVNGASAKWVLNGRGGNG
ncbi:MAG: hypothetical protein BWZ08_02457 [candidate division BRC1 bacterium ADurb.BinA292]|nr:MAG: hypothetical protein BWZ08_02457 [candidate division BRC1 bacterium ADurb.BinA292]